MPEALANTENFRGGESSIQFYAIQMRFKLVRRVKQTALISVFIALVMFAIEASPTKSESSSTSNTDNTSSSSSTYSVSSICNDFIDFQPPKQFGTGAKQDESPPGSQESFEEEYLGPWPKPKPGYTRRLIRMIRVPLDEVEEDFDEDAWNKKAYGQDVIVVDIRNVPYGWVLVDGNAPALSAILMIDPSPPKKKIKKRWNPFDIDDPNLDLNLGRTENGLPPIDEWNIGVEYTYKRIS